MQQWDLKLVRKDSPIPGRETASIEGPKLRQLVTAFTGQHNGEAPGIQWSPIRIDSFTMPTPQAPGSLSLVWLRWGSPPKSGVVGELRAVGHAVVGVTTIGAATTISLADLHHGPAPTEAEFHTLTPVRLGRRSGENDVDVLVPREELIVNGLIQEWAQIAQTDNSAPAVPDTVAAHLLANVVLSGHRGLRVVSRVVKRDQRTGEPHHRRAMTGAWRMRLIAGNDEHRQWFGALMRLAAISGIGRDQGIGGGRVRVDLPPRSTTRPDNHQQQRRPDPVGAPSERRG